MKEYKTLKEVPGSKGRYFISIDIPQGICISTNFNKTGKVKEMTQNLGNEGRLYWHLTINGKTINQQAARWIAITYPELVQNEYFEGAEIDHIDGVKDNNHPSNLRWVTTKENCNNPITVEQHREMAKQKAPWKGKHLTAETKRKIGEALKGKKLNEETKRKMSEALKGRKHTEEAKEKMGKKQLNHPSKSTPVVQYSLNGEYINDYPSAAEAERKTKIHKGNILMCCRGERKTAGNKKEKYRWAFA